MPERLTLGSLFDGSGGFPLAGKIAGITPVWASEIEPFPIRVTTKRIPEMKHYGDVRKMDGAKIEPVDIITFGSPCQDLSIAGHRKGLDGGRSGLFYEAIRIIEEMRRATNGEYPKYAVWENVTGAFSSNGGEDFRAVLENFCSVKQRVSISRPERWTPAGEIVGTEFSLAWRTLDAQYWGVPQRRRRIFVVIDFRGYRAGEILFERLSLSRNSEKSIGAWKRLAGRIRNSTEITDVGQESCFAAGFDSKQSGRAHGIGYEKEKSPTLKAEIVSSVLTKTFGIGGYKSYGMLSDNPRIGYYEAKTSRTIDCNGGNPCSQQGGMAVVYGISKDVFNHGRNAKFSAAVERELQPPIMSSNAAAVYANMRVRRLTPLECCRLQGFPDYWCDDLDTENPTAAELEFWDDVFKTVGKKKSENQLRKWLKNPRSDAAEYKMWGNGIALPCAVFILWSIATTELVKMSVNVS